MLTTLLFSALALYGCSVSSNIHTFGIFWIFFSFVFSAAWGAVGKIVRERFTKKEWALQLGLIYTGSRLGSMLSSLLYGDILRSAALSRASTNGWRIVFRVASGILAAAMTVSLVLSQLISSGNGTTDQLRSDSASTDTTSAPGMAGTRIEGPSPPAIIKSLKRSFTSADSKTVKWMNQGHSKNVPEEKGENIPEVLLRLSKDESFWLVLASKISFVCVRQFAAYLPFYLSTGHSMNPSAAAFASASFAVSTFTISNSFALQYILLRFARCAS